MNHTAEHLALCPWITSLPKGWSLCRLDDVADVLFSNVDKHSFDDEVPVRLCNYVDVYKNDVITAGLEFMEATAEPREIARFQLKPNDVLVTKDSEEPDDIAIPALVVDELPGVICGYHLAMIRPRSAMITGAFIAWLHRSKQFRAQYEAKAVGVTRYGLSQFAFRSARIPLPPLKEQELICNFLAHSCATIDSISESTTPKEDAVERRALLSQQEQILRAYRNSLIYECVTGARRVTHEELIHATTYA